MKVVKRILSLFILEARLFDDAVPGDMKRGFCLKRNKPLHEDAARHFWSF